MTRRENWDHAPPSLRSERLDLGGFIVIIISNLIFLHRGGATGKGTAAGVCLIRKGGLHLDAGEEVKQQEARGDDGRTPAAAAAAIAIRVWKKQTGMFLAGLLWICTVVQWAWRVKRRWATTNLQLVHMGHKG